MFLEIFLQKIPFLKDNQKKNISSSRKSLWVFKVETKWNLPFWLWEINTCAYNATWNLDILGISDMNSVGVRAVLRCSHFEIGCLNVHTFLKRNMNLLPILDLQIICFHILAVIEGQSLPIKRNLSFKKRKRFGQKYMLCGSFINNLLV